jgi:diguanylate cyclase (GGDEF)-like protein
VDEFFGGAPRLLLALAEPRRDMSEDAAPSARAVSPLSGLRLAVLISVGVAAPATVLYALLDTDSASTGLVVGAALAVFAAITAATSARTRTASAARTQSAASVYPGTVMLAETYHEMLSEETLTAGLERISDAISKLVTVDGVSIVRTDEPDGPLVIFERGTAPARNIARLDVPMVTRGATEGVLTVWRKGASNVFDEGEAQVIRWFADAAALALDNARARAALEHQAQTDSLTSLLNHRAFHDRLRTDLERVRTDGGAVALLLLDIDDFKRINDVHGHGVGDQVLCRIAGIIRAAARVDDHVCRIGGEEFAVIMPAGDAVGALALAHRIEQRIGECDLDPVGRITVSIGVAEGPRDASSARELAVCADSAMLLAKSTGKNRVVAYRPAAARPVTGGGRSRREEDLRSIAHLKMLQSLAGKLNRLNDVALIGRAIVDELRTLIDYHACRVYVTDGDLLVPVALHGEHEAYEDESVEALIVAFGEGVTGTAAERRESLLVHDAERCEFAVQIPDTETIEESMVAVPLLYGSRSVGAIVISKLGLNQFDESDVRLLEVLAGHASVAIENARLLETVRRKADGLEEDFFSTVEALANALEARDAETSTHARAITDLALSVGRELDLDPARLKRLELGALLHDIGKIGIPSEILGKRGPLTAEEYRIVQRHPELGERILTPIARLADVRAIVRHCHERWDGCGYPDRLAEKEIPLESRVILVVDAYHAMTTDRPYRLRLPEEEARRRLREGVGSQFDPEIVETFLVLLERDEPARALVA